MNLDECRKEINRIDEEMAKLFEARMNVSEAVAKYKIEHALPIYDKNRELDLIKKNSSYIQNEIIESYYVNFLKQIFELSRGYQARLMHGMKVAYCGVEGAFAHIAAKNMFPTAELVSYSNFADAYSAVDKGEQDCVVLPLENSYAGEVGPVMDLIFSGNLHINKVFDIPITHNLIANEDASLETIRKVISHPQALEQCEEYIKKHNLKTESFANTALAAKYVKELNDNTVAAIASEETANIFSMKILDSKINTSRNNTTRFAAFSRVENKIPANKKEGDERFILVFTVKNEAGSLVEPLNIIGKYGFNMRTLRSRPMKSLSWKYFFYVEAEGNINTENGKEMLEKLSEICAKLRLVGAYTTNN